MGDLIARLIGAPKGSVVAGGTLSIKVYQALAAAVSLRPQRRVILSDSGNFPAICTWQKDSSADSCTLAVKPEQSSLAANVSSGYKLEYIMCKKHLP